MNNVSISYARISKTQIIQVALTTEYYLGQAPGGRHLAERLLTDHGYVLFRFAPDTQ